MLTDFDELEVEPEANEDAVPIVYEIATYPSDFTLSVLVQMWKENDIIIPEFQRRFVWSKEQASRLIDSFLCGLPVPSVFFYLDQDDKNLVIDGQQRILSVVYFMEGHFGDENIEDGTKKVFRLSGLSEKSPHFGKTFQELDEKNQRKLKQSVLRAVNIKQLNPADEGTSAYYIFERLNTGGTPLKPQEIRNCIYGGRLNALLTQFNKDENWRKILGKKNLDRYQKDAEIILRLFALVGNTQNYERPMKDFLNKTMKTYKSGSHEKTKKFFELFPQITKIIISALQEKPFHLHGPLNVATLEAVMVVLFENFNDFNPIEFPTRYENLCGDKKFIELTSRSTADTNVLRDRIELARKFLLG